MKEVDLSAIRAKVSEEILDSIIEQRGRCHGIDCTSSPCPIKLLGTELNAGGCGEGLAAYYGDSYQSSTSDYYPMAVMFCRGLKELKTRKVLVLGDSYASIFAAMRS